MISYKPVICDKCKKEFNITTAKYKQYIKNNVKNICCSRKCKGLLSQNRIKTKCGNCLKEITVKMKEYKKSKSGKAFCSQSCSAIYNNKLKRKSKRSKIEERLFNLLVKEFSNLIILSNDKTMLNGLEVDIAIPELKLAIEWNGIVHFKPIYGGEKLQKIQNKDSEKLKIASEKDINLIVISDLVSNDKILNKAFEDIKNIIKNIQF